MRLHKTPLRVRTGQNLRSLGLKTILRTLSPMRVWIYAGSRRHRAYLKHRGTYLFLRSVKNNQKYGSPLTQNLKRMKPTKGL